MRKEEAQEPNLPNELRRHALSGAKVPRRVKRIGRADAVALVAVIGPSFASIPEGPSRKPGRAPDGGGVGTQEVDVVQRRPVTGAAENDKEEEQYSAGGQDERRERERRSCRQKPGS